MVNLMEEKNKLALDRDKKRFALKRKKMMFNQLSALYCPDSGAEESERVEAAKNAHAIYEATRPVKIAKPILNVAMPH